MPGPRPAAVPGPNPGVPPAGPGATPGETLIEIKPPPAPTNAPPEEILPAGTINFPGTDLNQVLTIYAELINRTILRPTTLPAPQITLKTQTPLTKKEAIAAFDAVFAMNGIATVPIGDKFIKVVPLAQAGQMGASWNKVPMENLPDLGQYVTHVVQLTNAKPSELVQVLQPFASSIPQPILPIDSSQILVLRDYTENVKRMLEMIKKIDVVVPSDFAEEVIPIKYALASEIASALNSLSTGGGGATVGSSGTAGSTTSGRSLTGSRMGSGAGGYNRPGIGGMQGNTMTGIPGQTGAYGAQGTTTPGAAAGSFTERLQNIIRRASVSGDIQVLGQTKIIADERTNSLLIFASKEDMKMIKDIVSKLDVVLAQVLIEAVIIEVSLNDSKDLGISYREKSSHGIDGFTGIGAIHNGNVLGLSDFQAGTGTNLLSSLSGGLNYLGSFGNDLDVTVTALSSDGRGKVLQRPRIQTSHAVPATLFVGESRPYPTGSYYGGGGFGGYSSIQQMQIGVSLEVTPLINPDGLVVMDIRQKIDSVKDTVKIDNVGNVPVTSSKEAQAKVAVRDRDTIILGGLIETTKNSSASGVPYLKDVPLLGYLFRSSSKNESRSELIVLIRPSVLPTPEIAALAAKSEKNKMPGVRRAEREIMDEESRRVHQADKDLRDN